MSEQDVNIPGAEPQEPRPPSLLDALIPVATLLVVIAFSIYLFGLDATNGPLQVGLFTAMSVAALIAHKNGHSYPVIGNA
ncbi:MAG: na+/H+ antiporter family protein, partial [Thermomicrobiales bacterium]|nr:na+/H+ antiporter family protein [Thermomicrobiales bacterium]